MQKYTRNGDREVLAVAYASAASRHLPLPIPTSAGIRTVLAELSSATPAAKNADLERFVSDKIAGEIEASGFIQRFYEK